VERTLYRPREIIQFCIESRERAIEIKTNKIDTNSVVTSEIKYSEKRTKDIAIEYKTQYPDLIHIFEAFRGSFYIMERKELEDLCAKIISGEIKTKDITWLENQSEEFLITVL
jgi:hypothetical protein